MVQDRVKFFVGSTMIGQLGVDVAHRSMFFAGVLTYLISQAVGARDLLLQHKNSNSQSSVHHFLKVEGGWMVPNRGSVAEEKRQKDSAREIGNQSTPWKMIRDEDITEDRTQLSESDSLALFRKGRLLYEGLGVARDRKAGRKLMEDAAEAGEGVALLYLARLSLDYGDQKRGERYLNLAKDWGEGSVVNEAAALHAFLSSSLCRNVVKTVFGEASGKELRSEIGAEKVSLGKTSEKSLRGAGVSNSMIDSICFAERDEMAKKVAKELIREEFYLGYVLLALFVEEGPHRRSKKELIEMNLMTAKDLVPKDHVYYAVTQWSTGKLHRQYLEKLAEVGHVAGMRELGERLIGEERVDEACAWFARLKDLRAHTGHELTKTCSALEDYKKILKKSAKNGSIESYLELLRIEKESLEGTKKIYQEARAVFSGYELDWLMGDISLEQQLLGDAKHFYLEGAKDLLLRSECPSCVEKRLLRIKSERIRHELTQLISPYLKKFRRLSGKRPSASSFGRHTIPLAGIMFSGCVVMVYAAWSKGWTMGYRHHVFKAR